MNNGTDAKPPTPSDITDQEIEKQVGSIETSDGLPPFKPVNLKEYKRLAKELSEPATLRGALIDALMTPNQSFKGIKKVPIELIWNLEEAIERLNHHSKGAK